MLKHNSFSASMIRYAFTYVIIFATVLQSNRVFLLAQVPSYVINVNNNKNQYALSSEEPLSSVGTSEDDYGFSPNGVLMTAANGKRFRCYMESSLKTSKDISMSDLVQDINAKQKKKEMNQMHKINEIL